MAAFAGGAPERSIQQGKTIKLHLSLGMVGLLIGSLVPAFAQSDAVSAKDRQVVTDLAKSWVAAYNRKDATGVAALHTEGGVSIAPAGIFQGHAAQQKWIENDLQAGGHDLSISVSDVHALGDALWSFGDWSGQYGSQTLRGHWSHIVVRVGDAWKIKQDTINLALPDTGSEPAR